MDTLLYETKYWEVLLIDKQEYLGRSVITLKRPCGELSKLSQQELLDFHKIIKKLENACKKGLGATMFNWTCLMNNAYKKENPKPQIHWHFRPKYNKPVTIANMTFSDDEFAHHYTKVRENIITDENLLEVIAQKIRDEF